MFYPKKLLLKFLELGLGFRTCFSLETKDPIFLNFKLQPNEAELVQKALPQGWTLQRIRFAESDKSSDYWISYNLYAVKYPTPELQHIKKVRCEINTFVTDPAGRKGVFVFSGSPYVSKEKKFDPFGVVCDMAERAVIFAYGCGKLIDLVYDLGPNSLSIECKEGPNNLRLSHDLKSEEDFCERLSDEYILYNDISFFNSGATYDLVNVSSSFFAAKFREIDGSELEEFQLEGPFFSGRRPNKVYYHRGEISYLVIAMNRMPKIVGAGG